ncbi:MAG: hypothetical protein HQL68_07620 [Magnetococcales bacterium]|nr:hypothetical protein [Magnetococcales bacterium]
MGLTSDYKECDERQEMLDIVRQAEELAYSTDWRKTAKTMRELRNKFNSFNLSDDDSLAVRFRIAQQTFMDRRADYFSRGNHNKGSNLQGELSDLEQQAAKLRESIQYCHNTLKDFKNRRANLDKSSDQTSIESFINESCKEVEDDIAQKTESLKFIESQMVMLSSSFCGP